MLHEMSNAGAGPFGSARDHHQIPAFADGMAVRAVVSNVETVGRAYKTFKGRDDVAYMTGIL